MYPFNAIIARQEYDRLDEVSRDFARGRLTAHTRLRRPLQLPAWLRLPALAAGNWRLTRGLPRLTQETKVRRWG